MDGEHNGKPYEQMDDLGGFPYFWKHPFLANFKTVPSVTFSGRFFRDPWCPCEEIKNQRMVENN